MPVLFGKYHQIINEIYPSHWNRIQRLISQENKEFVQTTVPNQRQSLNLDKINGTNNDSPSYYMR